MKIIKIDAIGSTNTYLKDLIKKSSVQDGTIIWTTHQTQGKGQMGASWHFEIGKSLAFSAFKQFEGLRIAHQFYVNFAVSLGVKKGLESLGIPKMAIKWPNDILADGKKVCGILVENQFQQMKLSSSVIGIGINVNNDQMNAFPQASSLMLNTGIRFPVEEVLEKTVAKVFLELERLTVDGLDALKQEYEGFLFRKGAISAFEMTDGTQLNGIIEGVSTNGSLLVRLENKAVQAFQTKSIKLLY